MTEAPGPPVRSVAPLVVTASNVILGEGELRRSYHLTLASVRFPALVATGGAVHAEEFGFDALPDPELFEAVGSVCRVELLSVLQNRVTGETYRLRTTMRARLKSLAPADDPNLFRVTFDDVGDYERSCGPVRADGSAADAPAQRQEALA